MQTVAWAKELPIAITVCGIDGTIIEMNDKSCKVFEKYGGAALSGRSVLDCHPEAARNKLQGMLDSPQVNCYTIEKNGVKKMIYQVPWYQEGQYAGMVELSMEIPLDVHHFIRE